MPTALALCGGVALFFASDVAYRWRDHHQIAVDRFVAATAAVVVIPLAVTAPSLVTLFTLTAVCALRTDGRSGIRLRSDPLRQPADGIPGRL